MVCENKYFPSRDDLECLYQLTREGIIVIFLYTSIYNYSYSYLSSFHLSRKQVGFVQKKGPVHYMNIMYMVVCIQLFFFLDCNSQVKTLRVRSITK